MSQALQVRSQRPTEVRNHAVDFSGVLEVGEKLVGTPTVTGSPAGLTLTNPQVTTAMRKINNKRVPAGQAVAFTCTGGTNGVAYVITVSCGTDSTPAETVQGTLNLTIQN